MGIDVLDVQEKLSFVELDEQGEFETGVFVGSVMEGGLDETARTGVLDG